MISAKMLNLLTKNLFTSKIYVVLRDDVNILTWTSHQQQRKGADWQNPLSAVPDYK
jgi:hypothetical protein